MLTDSSSRRNLEILMRVNQNGSGSCCGCGCCGLCGTKNAVWGAARSPSSLGSCSSLLATMFRPLVGLFQHSLTYLTRHGRNGRVCLYEILLPTNLDEHALQSLMLLAVSQSILFITSAARHRDFLQPKNQQLELLGAGFSYNYRSAGIVRSNPRLELLGAWAQEGWVSSPEGDTPQRKPRRNLPK